MPSEGGGGLFIFGGGTDIPDKIDGGGCEVKIDGGGRLTMGCIKVIELGAETCGIGMLGGIKRGGGIGGGTPGGIRGGGGPIMGGG